MRRRTRKQLPTIIGAASALAICMAGLGYVAYSTLGQRTADQYGCFDDIEQPHTTVWLDASQPRFSDEQGRSLRRYFDQLYTSLEFNERLSAFTSEGDQVGSVTKPRFHVCGQASRPEQLEAVNANGGQAGYLKKQKQRLYEKVLAPELDALLAAKPAAARRQLYQSPILEQIADLSRAGQLRPGSRLIIISDLIQNSDSAQFCRVQNDMPSFANFEKRRIYQQRLKPQSLEGVTVEVLMLQRQGYGQGGLRYCYNEEELRDFWRDYFVANGVKNSRFIRIRQGALGS